jgi:ribosomal-protein-alanine N-acetyltransferase
MISLRAAVAEDYDAFVPLFVELAIPEPPPSREAFGARFIANMTVAIAGEQVVGFIRWRAYGDLAHIINVVTHPAWRGQRIGQQLLEAVRAQVRAVGCTQWYLNVKQNNASAIALYVRCGFATDGTASVLRMPWAAVRTLPVPSNLVTTVGTPAEDAEIATTFQLPLGRVVFSRERSQFLVAHALPDPAPRGCAAFYAGMPGVAPLCASDIASAGALLHACLAFAEPDVESLTVVIERDATLAAYLLAQGAALQFELFSMAART